MELNKLKWEITQRRDNMSQFMMPYKKPSTILNNIRKASNTFENVKGAMEAVKKNDQKVNPINPLYRDIKSFVNFL
jgi:hypothetical protein